MPKNIYLPKENKKPTETVYEIKNEIPTFEEFMKTYENDEKINESYEDEVRSYGVIGIVKGYGPVYDPDIEA
jgi:radical SAM superfamily enzyme